MLHQIPGHLTPPQPSAFPHCIHNRIKRPFIKVLTYLPCPEPPSLTSKNPQEKSKPAREPGETLGQPTLAPSAYPAITCPRRMQGPTCDSDSQNPHSSLFRKLRNLLNVQSLGNWPPLLKRSHHQGLLFLEKSFLECWGSHIPARRSSGRASRGPSPFPSSASPTSPSKAEGNAVHFSPTDLLSLRHPPASLLLCPLVLSEKTVWVGMLHIADVTLTGWGTSPFCARSGQAC